MKGFLKDKNTLKKCHIYRMLLKSSREKHLSFHTPGHKIGKWDLTELSYTDNLSNPNGCILEAEKDIAKILRAHRSFILTDGSTSGIFSMFYALKKMGVTSVAIPLSSHKSVYNACSVFGIQPITFEMEKDEYGVENHIEFFDILGAIEKAGALFVTSPTYYGRVWEHAIFYKLKNFGKPIIVDGAHGGHLHYDRKLHPSDYADMWVDGVHKSLPALTQGAVVSAKDENFAKLLQEAVGIFRTTSPSYPIMASVEYAVKYPKNEELEKSVFNFYRENSTRIKLYDDYTKLCVLYGKNAFEAEKYFEQNGIYPEFCDGNIVMFYLSPATTKKQFETLKKYIVKSFPLFPCESVQLVPGSRILENFSENCGKELIDLEDSVGRVCANTCGLFPPCTPLILTGERITEEKMHLLKKADNTFGLQQKKISVLKEE